MYSSVGLCIKNWRIIHLLGLSTLRMRYGRSKLGQAWLTLSLFIQIVSTGMVWSLLWHTQLRDFLPYLAIGQTIYQFFSMIILDATTIFVTDSRLYINQYLPFLTSTLSSIYKNIIIFLHNIPVIVFLLLWFKIPVHFSFITLLYIPLLIIFLTASSFLISCICTRFRDLSQVVQSLMNILFLVTPIVWQLKYIPEKYRYLFFINPITGFLEIYRNSLLGSAISPYAFLSTIAWTFFSVICLACIYKKYERKIIFWI